MSWDKRIFQALTCVAAALSGAGLVLVGCSSSAEVKFAGAEHPSVPVAEVEILGDQTPAGFMVTGVVTAVCETMNGASGVFETDCTRDAMIALARQQAADKGAHALVDMQCDNELLERRFENLDGGGVKTTTRERLTCQATAVRRGRGGARPRPLSSAVSSRPAPARGRRVVIGDVALDVHFSPAAGQGALPPRDESAVGELDREPAGFAAIGELSATCTATCAPRHARAALRKEAARIGASAIAGVHCEVAGADRWQCDATLVGDALPSAGEQDAAVQDAAMHDAAVHDAAAEDAAAEDAAAEDAAEDAGTVDDERALNADS